MIEPDLLVATCSSDGHVLMRNSAWKAVFGEDEDLWGLLMPNDRETAEQNLNEAARGSLVTHALFMVESPHRDIPTPVLLHFVPVASDGAAASNAVAISGEVLAEPSTWTESQTHRHRMETLGRMTMGMAHDFNNLLSGILGHIELWRIESTLDDAAKSHVAMIEKAAENGAELISKIQRYIRQEAQSQHEPLDLAPLIAECVSFTRPYWYNEPRRQGINIEVHQHFEDLPSVEGSRSELRDVFVNMILNAVHAMPEGGSITLEGKASDSEVIIRLSDTGTGMSDDVQNRIFEPLFSTKAERGTGMGLSVVAGTMREHRGSVSVESTLGTGTTFTLRFPLSSLKDEADERGIPSGLKIESWRLLVVDDEEMVRNVVSRLLAVRGHDVVAVESGSEAVRVFESGDFDLIVTDQGMPEMTGRELAHNIRKLDPSIPILLLTGDTDIVVDSNEINHVLTKPFKIDEIESVIASLT